MSPDELNDRLSRIQTPWSLVFRAHKEGGPVVAAQQELLLRYCGAIYRYLLATVRDPVAADELAQDFAVRFLEGALHRAQPEKGRFRDLVKTTLRHLVIDHWRRQGKAGLRMAAEPLEQIAAPPTEGGDHDALFLEQWRQEVLRRTWEALEEAQTQTNQPCYTVLRWKTQEPALRSAELAERLGEQLGKPVTANAWRKLLHRARQQFAELLLEEVARSLGSSDPLMLADELIELGLLDFCRSALAHRTGSL
jgi:RNA polymerase sigma-70 factor (ECF subfamily)